MSFKEKMVLQCRKPTGLLGKFMGKRMNIRHSELWQWGLSHISINLDAFILDIGCGGGKAVQNLARIATSGKIYGVDYSQEMVQLAQKVNKKFIQNEHVEIRYGSVSSLPFANNMFDLVTAFETYYFWPNLINDLKEIKRILKPGGTLLMTNEAYTDKEFEKRNLKWSKLCDMMIHTPQEYLAFLTETGYIAVDISTFPKKNWITAVAQKANITEENKKPGEGSM